MNLDSIPDLLAATAARRGDRVAIEDGEDRLTYRELYKICLVFSGLLDAAIEPAVRHVGTYMDNSIEYVIAYFAIMLSNRVVVPLSPGSSRSELKADLLETDVTTVLCGSAKEGYVHEVEGIDIFWLKRRPLSLEVVARRSVFNTVRYGSSRHTALLLYTSGSTRRPMRVQLTHKGTLSNVYAHVESVGLRCTDRTLVTLPMFFGYCNTAQFLSHVYVGGTVVLYKRVFIPSAYIGALSERAITNVTCVPTSLELLHRALKRRRMVVPSLRFVCYGGAPVAPEREAQYANMVAPAALIATYGLTEAGPRVTSHIYGAGPVGTAGKAIRGVRIRIVDSEAHEVGCGRIGEIEVKGPSLMEGYYNRKRETTAVLRTCGWLRTGDLGLLDEGGYLFVTGRQKSTIITRGMNVQPEEVEACISSLSSCRECLVVGEPDDTRGERIVARVVSAMGVRIRPSDVLDHCRANLSHYKVPSKVMVVDDIPRTYNGKIRRSSG